MASLLWLFLFFNYAWAAMTTAARVAILRDHNDRRRAANANNMIELQYDFALERTAQAYIDSCPNPFKHNPDRSSDYAKQGGKNAGPTHSVGENWYSGAPYNNSEIENLFGAATGKWCDSTCVIVGWSATVPPSNFHCQTRGCSEEANFFQTPMFGQNCTQSGTWGHYTQVMWAVTGYMGCGWSECGGTLCNYAPSGNFNLPPSPVSASVIWGTTGAPCSNCPANYSYCDNGLCVEVSPSVAQCNSLPDTNIPSGDMADTCVPYLEGSTCYPVKCDKGPFYKVQLKCMNNEWEISDGSCEELGVKASAAAAGVMIPVSIAIVAGLLIGLRVMIGAKLREILPGPGNMLNSIVMSLIVVPFLLLCISAGTVYWATNSDIQSGLFKYCETGKDCQAIKLHDVDQRLITASQAFIILSILSLVPPFIIVILFWADRIERVPIIAHSIFYFSLASLIFSYICFVLYAAFFNDFFSVQPNLNMEVGWSFALVVIASFILLFTSVFTYHYSHSQGEPRAGGGEKLTKISTAEPTSPTRSTQATPAATPMSPSVPMSPSQAPPSPTSKPLNSDWEKVWDDNQKSHYYYNAKSGETQWEEPQ